MEKMAREREVLEVADSKKRKICDGDLHASSSTVACSRSYSAVAPVSLDSSTISSTENDVSSELACCASNGSSDGSSKFPNPDDEDSVDIATSKSNSEFQQRRKKIIYSRLKVELHKLESTKNVGCRHQATAAEKMMPSAVELDEFFAAAEKDLLALSVEKYNFDFVKEKPLQGRYEWVRQ